MQIYTTGQLEMKKKNLILALQKKKHLFTVEVKCFFEHPSQHCCRSDSEDPSF